MKNMIQGGMVLFGALLPAFSFAWETQLKLYRPFAETTKHPTPQIIKVLNGYCLQHSSKITREDAWRCMAGNQVYDPCFINTYGTKKQAICPLSPWFSDSVRIKFEKPLHGDGVRHESLDMSRHYPWAVKLPDGSACYAVEPGDFYEGLPVRYFCSQDKILIGDLRRCAAKWKILQKKNQDVSIIEIKEAWF